jgi:hypothetical protein
MRVCERGRKKNEKKKKNKKKGKQGKPSMRRLLNELYLSQQLQLGLDHVFSIRGLLWNSVRNEIFFLFFFSFATKSQKKKGWPIR